MDQIRTADTNDLSIIKRAEHLHNDESLVPVLLPNANNGLLEANLPSPTPTEHNLPFRLGDFDTLADTLDYAGDSQTGINFYGGRKLSLGSTLSYRQVRLMAISVARRMQGLNLPRGSKVAMVADTTPEFIVFFFACQYAGLVPVPLPAVVNVGGQEAFVYQLRGFIQDCQASIALTSSRFVNYLAESCFDIDLVFEGMYKDFVKLPEDHRPLQPIGPDEVAYVQYTSGSTRFPRGVMMHSKAVMANLAGILKYGVKMNPEDRACSWLPFYHDMGLVGKVMAPLASQCSVDFLNTREFAVRPRMWLQLMSDSKATVSFSPPFGYELCARRVRAKQAKLYDLSNWRVAGVGAEMIRSDILNNFATALEPANFNRSTFLPCYGMAECALATTFSKLDEVFETDTVDRDQFAEQGVAVNRTDTKSLRTLVSCGSALPEHEIQIRDTDNQKLPDRHVGTVFLSGPSLMQGYLNKPSLTEEALVDGWLNTGDLGYMADGRLYVTGRSKDMIIINGRNIWPQDLECVAESQLNVRSGDALAFALCDDTATNQAVVVVQVREQDQQKRAQLISSIQRTVHQDFGIHCHVQLVPAHTLPRTSSGKLSRSKARFNFMRLADTLISKPTK